MPNAPVEKKVRAATAAAYLASTTLLMILTVIQDQPGLIGWLPPYLTPWVLAVVPTAITFAAGYQAQHTPRLMSAPEPAVDPPAQDPTSQGPLG
jgi:hypothetical protein